MNSRTTRRLPVALAALGLVTFAASPAIAGTDTVRAEGPITSYSPTLVPEGAEGKVHVVYDTTGHTTVVLHVRGLQPDTKYGAHVHANPCGATGAAAGPHFQNVVDPHQPSTDPAYANPRNEIWLDFETNAAGNGVSRAKVDWQFSPDRRAGSIVLHEHHTSTGSTDSGTAGPRLGCLTVAF